MTHYRNAALAMAITVGMFFSTAAPAIADEVWDSTEGRIVYQDDLGTTAYMTYNDRENGALFIEGLGGDYSGGGTYLGYWIEDKASVRCATGREGRNGARSNYWGHFRIRFSHDRSRFDAKWSYCDRKATRPWTGEYARY